MIAFGGRRMFLVSAQDVTEKRRATQRMRVQQATTHALAECSTLAEASPMIFRAICENLGCDWGELWRVDSSARLLRCTQVWHPEGQRLPEMESYRRHATCARGEGIPGLVWTRNKTVWIADLKQEHRIQGTRIATSYGLRSVYAFPIRLNREV